MQKINTAETRYGVYEGVEEGNTFVFKGIPYAKAPAGERRFQKPEEPERFDGIRKADRFGNRCLQDPGRTVGFYDKEFYQDPVFATPLSEDSLILNIWTPNLLPEKRMPVLFYIHGGAFSGGCGHEIEFRTDAYARKDIVLVTINYRLGLSGFLALPELEKEDARANGNYGILDQIAALKWVRENIQAFGGDPRRVTICGQSAGGLSVETLLSCRDADGLYARAVIQSAGGFPQPLSENLPLGQAYSVGKRVLELAGASSVRDLRALPADRLMDVQRQIYAESSFLPFSPVVNGALLKEPLSQMMKTGQMYHVPTIIGGTKEDITVTPEEAAARDSQFLRSCIAYSQQNGELQNNPSYVYFFERELPGDNCGAFHSAELWYMFGTLGSCWRPFVEGDYLLSERMIAYWSNFIHNGSPDGKGLPSWRPCTRNDAFVQKFDLS